MPADPGPHGLLSAEACQGPIPWADPLDTAMAQGVRALLGALAIGLPAARDHLPLVAISPPPGIVVDADLSGLISAPFRAVPDSCGVIGLVAAIILIGLGALTPLRVSSEQEERGLDVAAHGQAANDPMTH